VEMPPHTPIDHLLHMELLGRPLSFLERDYTPAVGIPFVQHSLSFVPMGYPPTWSVQRRSYL
jgi:hypothetical protein